MKRWPFLIALFAAVIIQIGLLDKIRLFNVKPDLILIIMVLASLVFDTWRALIFGLFCGVFKDVFGSALFGANTALFAALCLLILRLSREISIDNGYLKVALIFIVSLAHNIAMGIIAISLGASIAFGIFLKIVVLGSVYTAAVSPLAVRVIDSLYPNKSL